MFFCSFRQETLLPKKKKMNKFWAKLEEEEEEKKKKNKKKRDDNKDTKKVKKVNPWAPISSRWARWATPCSSYTLSNTGPQYVQKRGTKGNSKDGCCCCRRERGLQNVDFWRTLRENLIKQDISRKNSSSSIPNLTWIR